MILCHSGPNPAADLAAVRALGDPIVDLVTPKPHVPLRKTEFLPQLSSEFLDAFREGALEVPSPLSQSLVFHLAGALNDREGDDGAVGNRDARYIGGFSGTWPPGAPADAYGDNYQRLQTVKATYDPDNLFRVNRNIPPAGH